MHTFFEGLLNLFGRWTQILSQALEKRFPGPIKRVKKYRSSLSFAVVNVMVLLAIIPVAVVATGTYIRSHAFIQGQAFQQLENLVSAESHQLTDIANVDQLYLNDFLNDGVNRQAITTLLDDPTNTSYRFSTWARLQDFVETRRKSHNSNIDSTIILSPDLKILSASRFDWLDLDLSGEPVFKQLSGSTKSFALYSLSSLYTNQWVTLSAKPVLDSSGALLATAIIADMPKSTQTIMDTAGSIFPGGKTYYVTFDNTLLGTNPKTGLINQLPDSSSHIEALKTIFQGSSHQGSGTFDDPNLVRVFAYAKWIPELNMGFVVEIPESQVFQQITNFVPFSLVLITISLLAITFIVFFGSRALVNPITQLTNSARNFAKGDWSERSTIQRRDEIGVLATTFNQMVEQLSDLYRSMEQKVEERARQLRTASEVGQLATSASNREEIIERAAKLVIDRFGYNFASIFILDQSGMSAVLMAAYSQSGEMRSLKGYRVAVSAETLVGWVAKNNQARVIPDLSSSEFPYNNILSSSSRSEVALPIAVGNELLGVFEVQTINLKGFEPESISVLQTLSNQIANGLQNLLLLESTQVNLQETNLLYRTSRQISLTKSETEMFQVVNEALAQTPYVSGIFTVEEDYLSILSITDPRNPSTINSVQGITLPLQRVRSALDHIQSIIIDDLTRVNEFDVILSFFTRRGCHSAAIFAIRDQGQLAKIIVLGSRESASISETAIQPFASLVEVVSTTRQRFQIMRNLEERVTTLLTLNRIGEAISAETDLMVLYQTLHDQVLQTIGPDISFLIALYKQRDNLIEIPYVYEGDQLISIPAYPLGEGLISIVITSRQPLMIVKDTEQRIQQLGAHITGKPAKSWLGVPLLLGTQAIGAMVLQDTEHEERFTQGDLSLFTTLAPQVAVSVRNAELLSEMQKALRDYEQERFLLNMLMSNTPDQVLFKDSQGHYIRASQSYANQFGIDDPLTLVGKSDYDLFPTDTAAARSRLEEQILLSGEAQIGSVERFEINQITNWKTSSHIPLIDPKGTKVGLLGIDHDITSMKQAEEIAEKRAGELQIIAEIARDTSGTLNTAELLEHAVNLIRDRFGFYHASIFLLDAIEEFAVLRESTGEVGAQMKQRGHRLAVGSQSIVGQVTERKQAWVVNNVDQEPLHYVNPLLPETRSELAIPLMIGQKILGAIDVQSKIPGAFNPDEVKVLQLLADQLAIAVWNSILFSQTQETLAQHRMLHQITIAATAANSTDEALQTTIQTLYGTNTDTRVMIMFLEEGQLSVRALAGYEGVDVRKYSPKPGEGVAGKAVTSRQPVRVNDFNAVPEYARLDASIQSELAVPIYFSDRTVGVLDLTSTQPGAFDETDQEIMASLGNTLGAIIANADLVREVRSQVQRQQVLYDITSRIRKTADIQSILETSAREIARSIGAKRASIELNIAATSRENETDTVQQQYGHKNGNGHKASNEVTQ
jgi:PAS domain S-box-containing protein